jgi:hypothetical protein
MIRAIPCHHVSISVVGTLAMLFLSSNASGQILNESAKLLASDGAARLPDDVARPPSAVDRVPDGLSAALSIPHPSPAAKDGAPTPFSGRELSPFYPPPSEGGAGGGWRRAIVMNRPNAYPPLNPPLQGGEVLPLRRAGAPSLPMVPHPCGARVGDGSTKTLRRLPCPSPTLRLRRRMGHPLTAGTMLSGRAAGPVPRLVP